MTRIVVTKIRKFRGFLMKNYLVLDYITMSHACLQDPGLRFDILHFSLGFILKSKEFLGKYISMFQMD